MPARKKTARGGAFIDKGAFGCVFDYIPCASSPDKLDQSKVSKVFLDPEEAQKEWDVTRVLAGIDPEQQSFVYPTHICKTHVRTVKTNDANRECSVMKYFGPLDQDDELEQIIMNKANMNLFDYLERHKKGHLTKLEVLMLLENIFKSVKLLLTNELVHQDIKTKNVLITGCIDSRKCNIARLADFGWMKTFKTFYINNDMWNKTYYIASPEMVYASPEMFVADVSNAISDKKKAITKAIGASSAKEWVSLAIDKTSKAALKVFLAKFQQNSNKVLEDSDSNSLTRVTPTIHKLARKYKFHEKYDVFSLGILMLECNQYTIDPEEDDPKVVDLYHKLMKGCVSITPDLRFTIDEALAVFDELPKAGGRREIKRRSSRRP
jgi:serine/threonine protein kinase